MADDVKVKLFDVFDIERRHFGGHEKCNGDSSYSPSTYVRQKNEMGYIKSPLRFFVIWLYSTTVVTGHPLEPFELLHLRCIRRFIIFSFSSAEFLKK